MLYSINKSSWSQAPSPLLIPNIHPLCGVVNGVDLDLGSEEEMWFSSKIMDKELKMIDWSGTATNWRSLLGNGVLLSAVLDHPRYLINSVFQYSLSLCHDLTSLVAKRCSRGGFGVCFSPSPSMQYASSLFIVGLAIIFLFSWALFWIRDKWSNGETETGWFQGSSSAQGNSTWGFCVFACATNYKRF